MAGSLSWKASPVGPVQPLILQMWKWRARKENTLAKVTQQDKGQRVFRTSILMPCASPSHQAVSWGTAHRPALHPSVLIHPSGMKRLSWVLRIQADFLPFGNVAGNGHAQSWAQGVEVGLQRGKRTGPARTQLPRRQKMIVLGAQGEQEQPKQKTRKVQLG